MDEGTRKRVLEPFFTTKGIGDHTGMGLAQAYRIVARHAGALSVSSQIKQGSKFTIYLPLLVEEDTQERKSQ